MTAARDDGGVPVVTTRLRNTGGRALVIGGELTLRKGPAGLDAGPFAFERSLALAPGDIGTLTVALDPDLPDGPWRARVTAVAGLLERTAEAEIAFPSAAAAQAPSQDTEIVAGTDEEGRDISESLRNQRRMLLPLASLLVLLAIAALWLLHQWRAEGATPGEDPVESEPPRGDEEAVGAER
jgi:hypothetical protein